MFRNIPAADLGLQQQQMVWRVREPFTELSSHLPAGGNAESRHAGHKQTDPTAGIPGLWTI